MSATSAEIDLQTTTRDVEQAVRTAEIALETATDNYRKISYPYTPRTFAVDIPAAINAIHDAEINLEKVKTGLGKEPDSAEYGDVRHQVTLAKENLALARQGMSLGMDPELFKGGKEAPLAVADVWSLRAGQFAVENAQLSLDKAKASFQSSLDKAQLSSDKAKVSLDQAKLSLEVAREDLNDAKDDLTKAVIMAPFDGFITKLNVSGGENVKRGMVAATIADPDKFEAEILVSEMDIRQVKVGGKASVDVAALQGLSLPAKVTHIAPTATVQSGVVNLKVEVEIQSIEAVPSDFQLSEGMTVTVSIVLQQKADVLLVPYAAITRQGEQSYVQVVSSTGTLEKRAIKTGITDYKNTEVTEGLREGEKVVIPQSTKTTTTTKQQSPGGIMIPGMGPPPPGGPK